MEMTTTRQRANVRAQEKHDRKMHLLKTQILRTIPSAGLVAGPDGRSVLENLMGDIGPLLTD